MSHASFPSSAETEARIAEIIKLDEIASDLAVQEAAARVALRTLQDKRIDALLKPEMVSPGSVEIKAGTERLWDLQSAVEACRAKRSELLKGALSSLLADQKRRHTEFLSEAATLRDEEAKLRTAWLTAMAAAALAQMKLLGFWKEMGIRGPGFIRLENGEWAFFRSEIDRLSAEEGIDAKALQPMAEKIRNALDSAALFRAPLGLADVETETEKARRV